MSEIIRILMADQDVAFQKSLQEYLELEDDLRCVGRLRNAEGIMEKISTAKPHILLLEVLLPPRGGMAVLKKIRQSWNAGELPVILISGSESEAILRQAAESGANYYLLKPFKPGILVERIRQLLGNTASSARLEYDSKVVKEICIRHFDLMGIPPHYKGYRYLLEGIWLACIHPHWLNAVTRKLYPGIGQRFNTSGAQVERAMRYALDVTWERGNIEQLYAFFPYEIAESKGKPTNSAFIAKMAGLVSLELSS
ncbi:MAG TPA: response regulator [Firmicutes bacterium]|nr:response regulator [Bacillota bacterium]